MNSNTFKINFSETYKNNITPWEGNELYLMQRERCRLSSSIQMWWNSQFREICALGTLNQSLLNVLASPINRISKLLFHNGKSHAIKYSKEYRVASTWKCIPHLTCCVQFISVKSFTEFSNQEYVHQLQRSLFMELIPTGLTQIQFDIEIRLCVVLKTLFP